MKQIFVVGLDDFHLAQLQTLPGANEYTFYPLLTYAEVKQQDNFPVAQLLDEGMGILQAFPGCVDAVIGYWDFPVSTTLPLLRRPLGLPGPSLEAVLQCEHKYWSRIRQAEVIPEHVPAFCAVDPFADDPLAQITLPYPFWLKPVKAVLSHLGFRINDAADFRTALQHIRTYISRYAEPFDLILQHAQLPPAVANIGGHYCIAEAMISSGFQCTQEGYAFAGGVHVYGTVDSMRCGPNQSSFSRYQYPSGLPEPVLQRMTGISRRVIEHVGYDMAPFNIEYFWDAGQDHIWLLEINTRLSKSHGPLFRRVDGHYHLQVMVDLGLGRQPQFNKGMGNCSIAAKFMVRHYANALVTRAPTRDEIAAVEAAVPHTQIQMAVQAGMHLSELRDQDSYSYEVATVFVGADHQAELEAKFHACMDRLPLRVEPIAQG